MADGSVAGDFREAVEELQAYLSDQVAPLLVADSIELLIAHPPELGADAIRSWVAWQVRGGGAGRGLSDYLFHAVKKIRLLADLKLVPGIVLTHWLEEVAEQLVGQAPAAEQAALREQVRLATTVEASPVPTSGILHRPGAGAGAAPTSGILHRPGAGAGVAAAPALSAEMARSLREFTTLLARLSPSGATDDRQVAVRAEVAPQLLVTAAQGARSQKEFEQYLSTISQAGLMKEVRLSDLFSTLSRGLPDWFLAGDDKSRAYRSAAVEAMHRIVAFAEDPAKTTAHFRELLKTAAEQFNAGSLSRAAQIHEVVRQLLTEKKVDKNSADLILATAHEDLDSGRLMAQTQETAHLPLFRHLLNAYPALTPHGLLAALDDEPDRSRRRLWLALLETHGAPGRQAALERLASSFEEKDPPAHLWMLQRNFVYLLHRIPAPEDADLAAEVTFSIYCAQLANPAPLVREALTNLGLRRTEAAVNALRQRLTEIENALQNPGQGQHPESELWRMLGLVITGLVRHGTPAARRAVIDHGLAQKPQLGDTLSRLAELGGTNLADDPESIGRLVAALRALLPVRILGLRLRNDEDAQQCLVKALSGTPVPAVRALFEEIVRRFGEKPFAQAAQAAIAAWDAAPAPTPAAIGATASSASMPIATAPVATAGLAGGLAGDLDVFGLPELLQTLGQMRASGRLTLRDREGATVGELLLRDGALVGAQVGKLALPDAVYQLLERPTAGTFGFTRQPPAAVVGASGTQEVMALLLEGMRRYDELQRARTLTPDQAVLQPTGARPTRLAEETDGGFIREVWSLVKASCTPLTIEAAVAADSFRVRALLGHWLTEGAIEIRTES